MKYYLLFTVFLLSLSVSSQRLDEYTASNGVTYKERDTIIMGRGSGLQGSFVYLMMGGWAAGQGLPSGTAGLPVIIKKIKSRKWRGVERVMFTVGGGNITNYWLFIEDAISVCEVTPCPTDKVEVVNKDDKYDKLAKIKKLFDDGVLTEEEFNTEKQKILDN